MYEMPDGMLSYIFIDQSLIYGALAGLFIVPFWIAAILLLFSLWQDDLWDEQQDVISFLYAQGFFPSSRSLRPFWIFQKSDIEIRLMGTPFGCWAKIIQKGAPQKRIPISKMEIAGLIGLPDQEEPISSLQSC